MGKKKKKSSFTSLFKARDKTLSFPWPSCKHPRTDSFRVGLCSDSNGNNVLKTINSVYLDVAAATPESTWLANSSSESAAGSFSTTASDQESSESSGAESLETVMQGVRSGRFFFEPAGDTKSILDQEAKGSFPAEAQAPFEESVVMTLESKDPLTDFRVSMEEMVEAHGLRDNWECLEELLQWYLRVNGRKNHGFVVGAFFDLLIRLLLTSATLEGVNENNEISEISPSN
ncbi:hypothetical protein ACLOJK_020804 [Asimina triloba]